MVVDRFYLFSFHQLSISPWNIGSHKYSTLKHSSVLMVRLQVCATALQWEATDVHGSLWLLTEAKKYQSLLSSSFLHRRPLLKADGASDRGQNHPAAHHMSDTSRCVWTRCIYMRFQMLMTTAVFLSVLIMCVCVHEQKMLFFTQSYN